MAKIKLVGGVVAGLAVVAFATPAEASHYYHGHIRYSVLDPINKPLEVKFDITTTAQTTLSTLGIHFGDGTASPPLSVVSLGQAFSPTGQYTIYHATTTHTYAGPGSYTAGFADCCRGSTVVNAGDDSYSVAALVDLTPGNTSNAGTQISPFVQMQTNGVRTFQIPAFDLDGVPISCRFATPVEAGDVNTVMPPRAYVSNIAPKLTATTNPPGCLLSWNLQGTDWGRQYAVQVIMETSNGSNGNISSSALDFIIETVAAPPPTCSPHTHHVIDIGQLMQTNIVGTAANGGNLTSFAIGEILGLLPAGGTVGPSPFSSAFVWTPTPNDVGWHFHTAGYTNGMNSSCSSTQTILVKPCPQYGQPCSAGVGVCQKSGILQCVNNNVVCSAVAGVPSSELCNGLDDDCDGVVDQNNPQSGMVCSTPLSGICSSGLSNCNAGTLQCIPDFLPGTVTETCDGQDQDCNGTVDDGFNVGATCSAGLGACASTGQIACDALGGAGCNATIGMPTPELCDGLDNDCDGTNDNGLGLGNTCTVGLGACAASGVVVCNPQGGTQCNAAAGMPMPDVCNDGIDNDCDGIVDNGCGDTDNDWLIDNVEDQYGTDKNDADSDDDGLLDGLENDPATDTDNDGFINALDFDSDNDGLFDGTEVGADCSQADTNPAAMHCIADSDIGFTTTNMLVVDTDGGSKSDGLEDTNKNGVVDAGETDPLDPNDDVSPAKPDCVSDADCGNGLSGKICTNQACVNGCRGANGNGCPTGNECSSLDNSAGTCSSVAIVPPPTIKEPTSDLSCAVSSSSQSGRGTWLGLLLGLALALRRRSRAKHD